MDIKNLKTFISVAELGSFTKAANEMNYVQSTVTSQIQQLEKELGYPVFDRIGKKVSLTTLGANFLKSAYSILNILEQAEDVGKDIYNMQGKLRIGVSESLMFDVIMKILPSFKAKFKNLEITVKTAHLNELFTALKQNLLDVIYISSDLNQDNELQSYYKRREELVFVCEKNYPLATQKNIPLYELTNHNFILTESDGFCNNKLKKYMSEKNIPLNISVEVDSVFVIAELVKSGMGLAFLPEFFIKSKLEDGSLVQLNLQSNPQYYYSQIIIHKSRWLSPFIEEFINMVKSFRPEKE